jgi:hypothetical protein
MESHVIASFHAGDAILAVGIAIVFIVLSSLIKEPHRRNFMAILLAGAGAAYLSGGGLGKWEFAGFAITFCAYKGLDSYRFIGLGWILHTIWDLVHHFYGNPLLPFMPTSSAGCAITDAIIAVWFFANAPSPRVMEFLSSASHRLRLFVSPIRRTSS